MALDFHIYGTEEYLYGLESNKFYDLEEDIFIPFKYRTGIYIDEYGDSQLSVDNQKLLIKIIDEYIEKTDLNKNKSKTKNILEFRGLLLYFIGKNYDLVLLGD
ncbi:hypothetical protein QJU96_08010 [Pasteurella skyensis]|uniref:Uncharacterized protein n=1 Tax=Phocoenobacter skyensis TaxID=97481 RepID=A0AAJ6ND85_9PAST|nr:hypothetical protein [Pasteurella skyensis]MDP8171228.1 hypothetical protein [Pasteurella skyensis]MDP8174676.1 hypothetical protein [Pasteurella skyensis]